MNMHRTKRMEYSFITLITLSILLLSFTSLRIEKSTAQQRYQIKLLSRSFVPKQGIEEDLSKILKITKRPRIHAILQFYKPLSLDEHKFIYESGILLQGYLGNLAYAVSIPKRFDLAADRIKKLIRWAGTFRPEDKIKRALSKKEIYDWAFDKKTGKIKLLVQFFRDVDGKIVTEDLRSLELVGKRHGADNSWSVLGPLELIPELARLDSVRMIQQGPIPFLPLNDRGREVTNSNEAQHANFSNPQLAFDKVSGRGFRIGICDSGVGQQHNDFFQINAVGNIGASRVYNQQIGGGNHGTHVASIAAGNGFNSVNYGLPAFNLRGHAPQAEIGDYGHFNGNAQSYYDAIVNDFTDLTNHSYVQSYAIYDAEATSLDLIVRGDGTDINGNPIPARPQVWAAGNNGTCAQYGDEEGYYAVFTSAKNTISVGSVDTIDRRLSNFSSLGPTLDGRIKPDVVAPGCADSIASPSVGIQAADSNSQGYTGKCGTSMAAPVVSGIIASMMEQFQNTYGNLPSLPSTYKAMLIHTARDLVKAWKYATRDFDNPDIGDATIYHAGPDYSTGYGLVDAEMARDIVTREKQWKEASLNSTGATHGWCIIVPEGTKEIKIVIAWDDEPGYTSTAEDSAKLVNDVDLELIDPYGNIYFPWTLDPLPLTANPGNGALDPIQLGNVDPAYRAADHRNNVEMVQICYPKAGIWKARITAFHLPIGIAQSYSLVSSHPISDWCIGDFEPSFCDRYPWFCDPMIALAAVKFLKEYGRWVIDPRVPVPVDEICKYVIDCPGCKGAGWAYCPGWRMAIDELPTDVNIVVINMFGAIILEDKNKLTSRTLHIERIRPGDQHFILFTDSKGNPYSGKLELIIRITRIKS